jgi:cytochrome oxidase Cu insertion factor (SCO1/SenC/PrrC family)
MLRTSLQLATIAVVATVISTVAAAEAEVGLAVGKKAPDFDLHDQAGNSVKSTELRKNGPIAIVFHRSANW